MTRDGWLKAHPYLQTFAAFRARVETAVHAAGVPSPPLADWDDYHSDFLEGVPLLHSTGARLDVAPAGPLIVNVVDRLAATSARDPLAVETNTLAAEIHHTPNAGDHTVDWLLGGEGFACSSLGLLRCLAWIAMTRYLRPVVDEFARRRQEERWLRAYCPTCGALPAMAQLIGIDPGRQRFLSCGCCGTRWRHARTGCPFCEVESHRLSVVAFEGDNTLRIDSCDSCRGYLKTYNGQGSEAVFLADWTSLHLDLVAQDRGLKRFAASLYDIGHAAVESSR